VKTDERLETADGSLPRAEQKGRTPDDRPSPSTVGLPPPSAALAVPLRQVTVVLPTYNEAENLGKIVRDLLGVQPPVNVLIVDDNSPDGTGAIADALAKDSGGRVNVLHRKRKSGLGDAYLAGFRPHSIRELSASSRWTPTSRIPWRRCRR